MPQPVRTFTDPAGKSWLVLDNGHRIELPSSPSMPEEGSGDEWVDETGDVMTGRLQIESEVNYGEPSGAAGLVLARTEYPMITLYKTAAAADAHLWNIYISGPANDPTPTLTLAPTDDSGAAQTYFRFYRDGRLNLGADPVNPRDAVTKQYADGLSYSGTVTCPVLASGATSSAFNLTFPAGQFTVPPMVFVTPGSTRLTYAIMTPPTTSGATLYFSNFSPAATAGAVTCYWLAVATPSALMAELLPVLDEESP